MQRVMGAITALSVLLLFAVTRAQLIPSLPDLPSPSPAASQSPLPAIVQEALESIVSELATPTPTPANASPIDGDPNPSALPAPEDSLPATAVPVLSETSLGPVAGNIQPESPDFVPEDSESDGVVESLAPDADENSSETEAESPPRAEFYVNGVCVRDVKRPRPVLGNSQVRSALTVISSAAALACASILYGLAADWEIEEEHVLIRLLMILLARVLTIGAVKLSAALVAAITKTSPEDGALDASGAFLTWGTAIFTRLYYEGFKMTMVAIGFINSERVWDRKLRDYLNPEYLSLKAFTDKDRNAGGVHAEEEEEEETIALRTESVLPHSGGNLPIMQRLLGGRIDRKLLMLCTLGYFASELSVLVANLLGLIGAFSNRARAPNYFAEDALGGQCGIQGKDWLVVAGLSSIQLFYALTQQPSLVPLLTVVASCPGCRSPRIQRILDKMRWLAVIVLLFWVLSIFSLPLFSKLLTPFFTSGDLSLFEYVILAPPTYSTLSYIITATYAFVAASVGTLIIYRLPYDKDMDLDRKVVK